MGEERFQEEMRMLLSTLKERAKETRYNRTADC